MRIFLASILFLPVGWSLVAATDALARPRGYDGWKVVRIDAGSADRVETLRRLDALTDEFELLDDHGRAGVLEARVAPGAVRLLTDRGLDYEVWIQDLQSWYDDAHQGDQHAGFFDAYHTHDEHVAFLNDLVAAYPELAEMVDLGPSRLGRRLWAIHITGSGSGKPGVLYHGGQHGNEIMGPAVVAYLAEYLLTRYDTDANVRAVVDGVDWYLLTIMNPDGYEAGTRYNAAAVDLNRNWGGPGSAPYAFSQPETATIRDFFIAHPAIRAYIDFHTFGRLVTWPWGHTPALCADESVYRVLGDRMRDLIGAYRGTTYVDGPVNTTIYPVHGGSVDYTYYSHGVWSFVYELGYSHFMPATEILPTCQDVTPAAIHLAAWILDCNENGVPDETDLTEGISTDCNADTVPDECVPPVLPSQREAPPINKNRFLSFVGGNPGMQTAVRVHFVDLPAPYDAWDGTSMWVDRPFDVCELGSVAGIKNCPPGMAFKAARLTCDGPRFYADWTSFGTVHVYHEGIVPGGQYEIQEVAVGCDPTLNTSFATPLVIETGAWADVCGYFDASGEQWTTPDGAIDVATDVVALIDKFAGWPGAPPKAWSDLEPPSLDLVLNITDVVVAVDAFSGVGYPFQPSSADPCLVGP